MYLEGILILTDDCEEEDISELIKYILFLTCMLYDDSWQTCFI